MKPSSGTVLGVFRQLQSCLLGPRLRPLRMSVVLALCGACQPGGPDEPEPGLVSVQIRAANGVTPEGPLRLAVVWREGSAFDSHWVTTADVPVAAVNAKQPVVVQLPPKDVRQRLTERSEVYIECSDNSTYFEADVLEPAFVVYEDLDGNGAFNPSLPNSAGADRVWAAAPTANDSPMLVAFADLDESLSHAPTEVAECVREHTLGRYTAFFMAIDYSSYVMPADSALRVNLDLSPTDYPRVLLGCSGGAASNSPSSYSSTTYGSRSAYVDPPVQTDACASSPYSCKVADVASNLPSDFTTVRYPGYSHSFACMVSGSLDVLWMTDSLLSCKGCDCKWTETDVAWVVDSAAPPPNWPCGAALKYCNTPEDSLWKPVTYCAGSSVKRPL